MDGRLYRLATVNQPDGRSSSFWGSPELVGESAGDDYVVVGFVEGDHASISWSTPDGATGAVDGVIRDAVPGYTVFFVTMPHPEGGFLNVIERHGKKVVVNPDGATWPPDLTIHADDWSCTLAKCGSVG